MGTFDGTCYISHLPICRGEDVVLLPLIKPYEVEKNNCCYAVENYVPFGLSIRGKYNEYGGIENLTTLKENVDFFHQFNYYEKPDDVTKPNEFILLDTPDEFEDFVNRILCSYRDVYVEAIGEDGTKIAKIHWIMMHAELYDNILFEIGNREPAGTNVPYRDLLKTRYDGILEMHRKSMKLGKAASEENKNEQSVIDLLAKLRDSLVQCISYDIVGDLLIGADYTHWQYWGELLLDDDSDALLWEFVKRTMFTFALGMMRNGYHCVSGAGSSEKEMKLQVVVAEFIINHYNQHGKDGIAPLYFHS